MNPRTVFEWNGHSCPTLKADFIGNAYRYLYFRMFHVHSPDHAITITLVVERDEPYDSLHSPVSSQLNDDLN